MLHRIVLVIATIELMISASIVRADDLSENSTALINDQSQQENAWAAYAGPQYTIEVARFENKVPEKVSDVGDSTVTILRTQMEIANLRTVMFEDDVGKDTTKNAGHQQSDNMLHGERVPVNYVDSPDYRMTGSVTTYSEVEEGIDTSTFKKKSVVARVSIDYAFVDSSTGKLIMSESGTGEYRKNSSGSLNNGTRLSFDPYLRDGSLRDALAKVTEKVIRKLSSMTFQGKLLTVDSPALLLKAGTRSQLKAGTQLAVYHMDEIQIGSDNIQTPVYRENKIGVIKVNRHQNENLSEASILFGSGFKIGDIVRPIP